MSAQADQSAPEAATPGAAPKPLDLAYRRYSLTILLLAFIMNFVDRRIVTILAEPIKNDLHLADWQIGATTGLAFALFYSGLGVPIARLAARVHRPWRPLGVGM